MRCRYNTINCIHNTLIVPTHKRQGKGGGGGGGGGCLSSWSWVKGLIYDSTFVNELLYLILCYVELCYNGTRLYYHDRPPMVYVVQVNSRKRAIGPIQCESMSFPPNILLRNHINTRTAVISLETSSAILIYVVWWRFTYSQPIKPQKLRRFAS